MYEKEQYSQHSSFKKSSCFIKENLRKKSIFSPPIGNTMDKLYKIYIPNIISSMNKSRGHLKYNLNRKNFSNLLCSSMNKTTIYKRNQYSSFNFGNILSTFRNIKQKRKILDCSLFIPKIRIRSNKGVKNMNTLKINKLLFNAMKRARKIHDKTTPLNKHSNVKLFNKTLNLNGIKFKISKSPKSFWINNIMYYRKNLFNYNFNNY